MSWKALNKTVLVVFLISLFQIEVSANCPTCTGSIKTYLGTAPLSVNSGNNNNQNNPFWDLGIVPGSDDIAQFNDGRSYTWSANGETIKGIILSGNSSLTLDRPNEGNNPSFIIGGTPTNKGCITIRSGSTLNLKYITNLEHVNICVEDGGKIIIDSRNENRNDYIFNGVDINLGGPNAQIEFGEADIIIGNAGLGISGYTGTGCTLNADGSFSLPNPIPNITADPNKTNIEDFCQFLDAAGFGILPVEYIYFKSNFDNLKRAVKLSWATAKEINNSHFEVERAINSITNWNKIAEIEGVGWSDIPVDYSLYDEDLPLSGGIAYYRIKQIDFDGNLSYSETISERIGKIESTGKTWRVFPNPTSGNINIGLLELEKYRGEDISVKLINSGINATAIISKNIGSISSEVSRMLQTSKPGVYVLEISWGANVERFRILKN
ncbi:MAG: T9SS C-terminal target domain-containing protein [Mongoliibacter sp.]|nr:MAG: T9SS C-terminal target domain-containing protein [Mongoliibacter sp.]